jgi:hypothetical protein
MNYLDNLLSRKTSTPLPSLAPHTYAHLELPSLFVTIAIATFFRSSKVCPTCQHSLSKTLLQPTLLGRTTQHSPTGTPTRERSVEWRGFRCRPYLILSRKRKNRDNYDYRLGIYTCMKRVQQDDERAEMASLASLFL